MKSLKAKDIWFRTEILIEALKTDREMNRCSTAKADPAAARCGSHHQSDSKPLYDMDVD